MIILAGFNPIIFGGISMNLLLTAAAAGGEASVGMSMVSLLIMIVPFGLLFYFMLVRPQKKEQKRFNEMMSGLEVGDVIVTTGGFYGVVIDISEEDVIVEFGNNKNCRIPMRKTAIAQVEKAEQQ
jgi:preprotein translocase subunit YajC